MSCCPHKNLFGHKNHDGGAQLVGKLYSSICSLRFQLFCVQLAVVFSLVLLAAVVASSIAATGKRAAAEERIVGIAREVADLPVVLAALREGDDKSQVVEVARLIEKASKLDFVVVVDLAGIRLSHPEDDRLGLPVSSDHREVQQGREFIGVEEGTRGSTFRVKVPVYDGTVIVGSVSVGILEAQLQEQLQPDLPVVLIWLVFAVVFGTAAAVLVTRLVWRRIYGQEPAQILRSLRSHEAMMTDVHEGVIAVDESLRIVVANREARRLLDQPNFVSQPEFASQPDSISQPDPSAQPSPQPWEGMLAAEVLPAALNEFIMASAGERKQSLLQVGQRTLLAGTDGTLLAGQPIGRVLTLQDRTELREAIGELAEQRELARTLRSNTHEFANRLHIMAGLLEMGQVRQAAEYLDELIVPRGNEADIPAGVRDLKLVALLRIKSAIADRVGVSVLVDQSSAVASQRVVDDDAMTVLANLITNGIEAAGEGGTVEISVSDKGGFFRCRVSDDGPGILPEARPGIFDYGVSSKAAELPEDRRGVGLALVQQIVHRRGGSMDVAEGTMGGAMISVQLPAARGGCDAK